MLECDRKTNLKSSLVKTVLEAYPNLVFAKGPHGFSLLHHAEKGGEDAENIVVRYKRTQSEALTNRSKKIERKWIPDNRHRFFP